LTFAGLNEGHLSTTIADSVYDRDWETHSMATKNGNSSGDLSTRTSSSGSVDGGSTNTFLNTAFWPAGLCIVSIVAIDGTTIVV